MPEEKRNNIKNIVASNIEQQFDFFFQPSHIEVLYVDILRSTVQNLAGDLNAPQVSINQFYWSIAQIGHSFIIMGVVRNARGHFFVNIE